MEDKRQERPTIKIGSGKDHTAEHTAEIPVLTGKDMNALLYLILKKLGTIEIPQEVFDTAPGPDKIKIEMQWDAVNRIWRFFVKRQIRKKPELHLPQHKRLIGI